MTVDLKGNGTIIPLEQCQPFLEDPKFTKVRETLNKSSKTPPKMVQELTNPGSEIKNASTRMSSNMDNVFFHSDRFEVLIDARGFSPQNIKCMVTPVTIEIVAETEDAAANSEKGIKRGMCMTRTYQLPKGVNPAESSCWLSSDGILVISAAWVKK